jgi:hypothetical protein
MNATGCRAQWAESRKRRVERYLATPASGLLAEIVEAIRTPLQEGDASKYGSTARASNFSSVDLRSSVTLGNRSCTSCAAMPQNSRELPPESPLGLTGKSEQSLSRFELCSERRRTKKTQHVPTNATNAGDLRPWGRTVLPPPIRPIARDRRFGIAGEHHDL